MHLTNSLLIPLITLNHIYRSHQCRLPRAATWLHIKEGIEQTRVSLVTTWIWLVSLNDMTSSSYSRIGALDVHVQGNQLY
jgi:hypothetical protein